VSVRACAGTGGRAARGTLCNSAGRGGAPCPAREGGRCCREAGRDARPTCRGVEVAWRGDPGGEEVELETARRDVPSRNSVFGSAWTGRHGGLTHRRLRVLRTRLRVGRGDGFGGAVRLKEWGKRGSGPSRLVGRWHGRTSRPWHTSPWHTRLGNGMKSGGAGLRDCQGTWVASWAMRVLRTRGGQGRPPLPGWGDWVREGETARRVLCRNDLDN